MGLLGMWVETFTGQFVNIEKLHYLWIRGNEGDILACVMGVLVDAAGDGRNDGREFSLYTGSYDECLDFRAWLKGCLIEKGIFLSYEDSIEY